eukprot:jgi/Ulvmu1/9523/UM053_0011.1
MSPPKKVKQIFLVPQELGDVSDDETVLFVCDAVKASVAKRSALLSGLLDTSGVVKIPEGIAFDDFRLWAKAGQAVKLSDRDLATVVRVAHELSDHQADKWIKILASSILNVNWAPGGNSDALHSTLIALPCHVLHLVLRAALRSATPEDLFTKLPSTLHPHVISSMIDASSTLSVRLPTCATTFLAHLRYLPAPQIALRSLELHICAPDPAVTATLLAAALITHSSLTTLTLTGPFVCDATLATLHPALLRLPTVHSLSLTQGRFTCSALPHLRRVLSRASSLRHLALSGLNLPADPPLCRSETASIAPLLAAATGLTSLHIDGSHLCSDTAACSGSAVTPTAVTLPHVRKLKLYESSAPRSASTPCLPALALPALGNLTLSLRDERRSSGNSGDTKGPSMDSRSYAARVKPSLQHIAALTTLEVLTVNTAEFGAMEENGHAVLAASLRALPALVGLDMHTGNFTSAVRALTPFLEATSQLIVLRMTCAACPAGADAAAAAAATVAWEPFMHALAQHSMLQELQLPHDAGLFRGAVGAPRPPAAEAAAQPPLAGPLAAALPQLQQLTRLVLVPRDERPDLPPSERCRVDCQSLAPAVSRLRGLRELSFFAITLAAPAALIAALPALPRLESLRLDGAGLSDADGRALAAALPSLPRLSHLDLGRTPLAAAALDVAAAALALPRLADATLCVLRDVARDDDVHPQLLQAEARAEARGARINFQVRL